MITNSPNFPIQFFILKILCNNQHVHACGHHDVFFKCVATGTKPDEHEDEGLPEQLGY